MYVRTYVCMYSAKYIKARPFIEGEFFWNPSQRLTNHIHIYSFILSLFLFRFLLFFYYQIGT